MSRCSLCNAKGFTEARSTHSLLFKLLTTNEDPPSIHPPPHDDTPTQVPKAEILLRADVPAKVKANVETFWTCTNPGCEKLFWEVRAV